MKKALYLLSLLLPWEWRRRLLGRVWGFQLHPTSRIGLSWVMPARLVMGPNARIGNLTVCKGLQQLEMGADSYLGNGNWISGFPLGPTPDGLAFFAHRTDRRPILIMEEHSAITHRHLIDCTDAVRIGRYATLAGYASQILTHSIDVEQSRQDCAPISVGAYCFVGTNSVLLGGAQLPDYSVLAAKSLLNKPHAEPFTLYGGVPAKPLREMPRDSRYFHRKTGLVV